MTAKTITKEYDPPLKIDSDEAYAEVCHDLGAIWGEANGTTASRQKKRRWFDPPPKHPLWHRRPSQCVGCKIRFDGRPGGPDRDWPTVPCYNCKNFHEIRLIEQAEKAGLPPWELRR